MPKDATKSRARPSKPGPSNAKKPKDPKASHLYTDDNPATTIHGTGFKDAAAALRTLDLINQRSLTYQFQTVNTMYNRAKHHPSMKKKVEGSSGLADMCAAMDIFRTWLDETYPTQRAALRAGGFKPLLSKALVERFLPRIEADSTIAEDAKVFARKYATLPKGKRLGNVLVDDTRPREPDWERKRYDSLDALVPVSGENTDHDWSPLDLWAEGHEPSARHLSMLAWAWSPVAESKLSSQLKLSE